MLSAQKWGQTFEQLGASVRIRRGAFSEKLSIHESVNGRVRSVRVVGRLGARGRLSFSDRTIRPGEKAALKNWIDELSLYGAAGAPDDKPLWGLTQVQFDELRKRLSARVETDTSELDLLEAVALLKTSRRYPVGISDKSQRWLESEFGTPIRTRRNLSGFSSATALAMLLNDYGLGFRPIRQPSGEIRLVVDPLRVSADVWPVGWDPTESPLVTAPELMEIVDVEFKDIALPDLFAAIEARTRIPILIDDYRMEGFSIDFENLKTSLPPKRVTWLRVISSAASRNFLRHRLRTDENDKPFVWISAIKTRRGQKPLRK